MSFITITAIGFAGLKNLSDAAGLLPWGLKQVSGSFSILHLKLLNFYLKAKSSDNEL